MVMGNDRNVIVEFKLGKYMRKMFLSVIDKGGWEGLCIICFCIICFLRSLYNLFFKKHTQETVVTCPLFTVK